jgi:hypothetical protein
VGIPLCFGIAACPSEGVDPAHLIELAGRRLEEAFRSKTKSK